MQDVCSNEIAELFQLEIEAANLKKMMAKGETVNTFFSTLEGYIGLEIILLHENTMCVLLRWKNSHLFEQHLAQILHSCVITDWFSGAKSVQHQPVIIKSFDAT